MLILGILFHIRYTWKEFEACHSDKCFGNHGCQKQMILIQIAQVGLLLEKTGLIFPEKLFVSYS